MTKKKAASSKTPLEKTASLEADPPLHQDAQQEKDFLIVGIGASAGGLAAFEAFFSGMPTDIDPGMAFVLVQHLAQDQHDRAIGIVLSGTGSDGTLGIRAIKGKGGMVMVQNPKSTEYDGMPRSAIATGLVDYGLLPADMPAQLIAYAAHAFGKMPEAAATLTPKTENALKKIFILLRAQTGHDFSQYKPSTINRRIERRMAIHQIETMDEFVKYLQQTPAEMEALFRDLLIGVTSFFRGPEAFKALEELIIPRIFAGKSARAVIRVWSPGSSTGEEAYSLAILLAERQEEMKLYQRKEDIYGTKHVTLGRFMPPMTTIDASLQKSATNRSDTGKSSLRSLTERTLLEQVAPAAVLVNGQDLSRANNDMNNLLAGTGIATIFVDHQLRILRFTPAATRISNMIGGDVGRPVGHIVTNLANYDQLVTDVKTVLDTLVPKEIEVQTQDGRWYTMRILPYRTLENVIEGAVITFVDITEEKKTEGALQETEKMFKSLFENTLNAVSIHEIVLDTQGRAVDDTFLQVNPAFEKHTGMHAKDVLGKRITQIYPGTEKKDLIEIYGKVALTGKPAYFKRFFEREQRYCNINAYQVGKGRFAVVFEDITDILPQYGAGQETKETMAQSESEPQ